VCVCVRETERERQRERERERERERKRETRPGLTQDVVVNCLFKCADIHTALESIKDDVMFVVSESV